MNWRRAGDVDKDRNIELTTSDFHQDKKQPEKKERKRMSMGIGLNPIFTDYAPARLIKHGVQAKPEFPISGSIHSKTAKNKGRGISYANRPSLQSNPSNR